MMEISLQLLRGTALIRILVRRQDAFCEEMNVQRESVDLPLSGLKYLLSRLSTDVPFTTTLYACCFDSSVSSYWATCPASSTFHLLVTS